MTGGSFARLDALAGGAPPRARSVRDLAAFAATSGCDLAALGFAAGVHLDKLLAGTAFEAPFGQSPFAIQRGNRFERQIGADANFGPLIALLREQLGFDATEVRVANLRELSSGGRPTKEDMALRAHETRKLLAAMLRDEPDGHNLIAGAVLEAEILGRTVRFEADALAFRIGDQLRVLEIKSFPTVDRTCDPEKAGAALDQAATYVVVLRRMVGALDADPARVSDEALLVTPKNTGMQPVLHRQSVASRARRIERILAALPEAMLLADRAPAGRHFGQVADQESSEDDRLVAFEELADTVGTRYTPGCLAVCGASRLCRSRAAAAGDPGICGQRAVNELPGVASLGRAAELAAGAPPSLEEQAAAEKLRRAARLFDRASAA